MTRHRAPSVQWVEVNAAPRVGATGITLRTLQYVSAMEANGGTRKSIQATSEDLRRSYCTELDALFSMLERLERRDQLA
eukprot:COSAG02_NODE_6165_length_3755_cov_1.722101_4_plen_79_part_00